MYNISIATPLDYQLCHASQPDTHQNGVAAVFAGFCLMSQENKPLRVRTHGTKGPPVIVLHGGPAAPGSAIGLAEILAADFRVIEPFQRGSGDGPLSVARHVEDLQLLLRRHCRSPRPAIVGWSWGAMLALAYASAYPQSVGPLVLVGCGTFDEASRARLGETLELRTDDDLRRRLARLPDEYPDSACRMLKHHELTKKLYDYDSLDDSGDFSLLEHFDLQAHEETW